MGTTKDSGTLLGKSEGTDHLRDVGGDGRVLLKLIFNCQNINLEARLNQARRASNGGLV
jgi:hypothetical protein